MSEHGSKRIAPAGFIADTPKVELHLHLEGTVGPDLLERLQSGRERLNREELHGLYNFGNFEGFLAAFRRVIGLLSEPQDFFLVTESLCRKLAAQRVVYAECIFTPMIHTARGLDHKEVIGAVLRAVRESGERGGPRLKLIYDTVRQWGADAALECAKIAAEDRSAGLPVVAFGVGGDELSLPADELKEAFDLAGRAGLKRYVHAGEVGGADSVWEALEILGADRIGHGIAAVQDPSLLKTLAAGQVALDCCPTSNLMTRAVDKIEKHPLPLLLESGVPVTLGSDDPGFFGSWLQDEIMLCTRTWNWSKETVSNLILAGARHCFLEPEEKERLVRQLETESPAI
jgi:aminodeoxyfutalosine deaminase